VGGTRQRVLGFVNASWGQLDSWREPDIAAFAAKVAPVIAGGQRQVASLTDSYIAMLASITLETSVHPVGIPTKAVTDEAIRGVNVVEVFKRTGPTVWAALAGGASIDEAVQQGLQRALVMASTDLQLAKTTASQYALERQPRATGYQRVPDDGACDLCLLASTQRYHVGDLMPIHDRCGCDVEPLFADESSGGQVINEDLRSSLEEKGVTVYRGDGEQSFYGTVGDAHIGVAVEQHGELGPVLTVAGQQFTSEADLS
jgi:hypothetical protein